MSFLKIPSEKTVPDYGSPNHAAEAWMAVRYVLVGGAAAGLYFAVALFLKDGAGLSSQAASGLGVTAAAVFAYLGHHRVTFAASGEHGRYAPRFFAIVVTGYLVSFLLIKVVVEAGLADYAVGTLLIACVNATLSYAANRLLVFRSVSALSDRGRVVENDAGIQDPGRVGS